MNADKAYEILDSISDKNLVNSKDINTLVQLSQHDDAEIRAYVAELLILSTDHKAENTLIKLCKDKDELVRVNACDSLSAFTTVDAYRQLVNCILNDSSLLVKNYATLSLVDIINFIEIDRNEVKKIFLSLSKKNETSILASCFKGLYVLGYKEYLKNIIDLLATENYQDRCTIINVLGDIITNDNNQIILPVLKDLKKTENSKAVNSIIDKIITQW